MKKKVILFIDGKLQMEEKAPQNEVQDIPIQFDDMEKCREFIKEHAKKSGEQSLQHTYQPAQLSKVIKPKVKTIVTM